MTGILPTLVGLATILAGIGGAWFIVKYVTAQDTAAELQAKDGAIATQAQVNDANEHRIDQLEKDVLRLSEENSNLKGKVEFLEQYSAQALAERIEAQQDVMIGILQAIQLELTTK
jgi:predicted nuclease with TOPRIM domain